MYRINIVKTVLYYAINAYLGLGLFDIFGTGYPNRYLIISNRYLSRLLIKNVKIIKNIEIIEMIDKGLSIKGGLRDIRSIEVQCPFDR